MYTGFYSTELFTSSKANVKVALQQAIMAQRRRRGSIALPFL
jgi:hypothetical protein